MTNKSLIYVVLAVTVGYMLVSAVPHQVSMYMSPQQMLKSDDQLESTPSTEDGVLSSQELTPNISGGGSERIRDTSFLEMTKLPELMIWWTLDILVALTIYWVAKRKLV
jgi:hypothetical protein